MNALKRAARRLVTPRLGEQFLVSLLSLALLFATLPPSLAASQDAQGPPPEQATEQAPPSNAPNGQAPPYTQQNPEQLDQLVAPIALYPDSLVAQILAAATFPEQVVEADRWVQAHPDLKGDDLAKAVDQQPWDPSVKALTAFPTVLGNMDKNLSWTSSLGDAYYNQQQDVMDAVQTMRERAKDSGNLKDTEQQKIKTEGSTIVIEPANPEVVYVPAYDPWIVYGDPLLPWPGWYEYPGIWWGGPYLSFGVGFGIGFFAGYGWGWGGWGFDWRHHYPIYDHGRYFSRSNTFYNRNYFYRGGGRDEFHGAGRPFDHPFNGDNRAARGFGTPRDERGTHSGAFDGFGHGGDSRGYSERGHSSFGGGEFHGGGFGGGGFHGGGGGRGGGRR